MGHESDRSDDLRRELRVTRAAIEALIAARAERYATDGAEGGSFTAQEAEDYARLVTRETRLMAALRERPSES